MRTVVPRTAPSGRNSPVFSLPIAAVFYAALLPLFLAGMNTVQYITYLRHYRGHRLSAWLVTVAYFAVLVKSGCDIATLDAEVRLITSQ